MTSTLDAPEVAQRAEEGPLTRRRLRRTGALLALQWIVGAVLLLVAAPTWQSFGAGLLWPGAGFLTAGGWWSVAAPVALVLFFLALVAWFGAGGQIFPPIVWYGSAGLAAVATGDAISSVGLVVGLVVLALLVGGQRAYHLTTRKAARAKRSVRLAYLPQALAEAETRATAAPEPFAVEREIDPDALSSLRYVFDRALQPVGSFEGYDVIDQFQTSSLRYQINQFGYVLSVMQANYTPNFHGYGTEAQRRLIDTYLTPKVWQYWRLENAWGNLRIDGNPVGKDNIMLTGFFGLQVALYTGLTGDQRYAEPGGLTFSRTKRQTYEHSLHTIVGSLMDNYRAAPFCLYPCEPNWTYTPCNFRGLAALQAYDRVYGTTYFDEIKDDFRRHLDAEFTRGDFGMVALRSMLTGLAVPFPVPDATLPLFLASLFPDLAARYWAFVREEAFEIRDGRLEAIVPRGAVDMTNYKSGFGQVFETLLGAAREAGDEEAAQAALRALDEHCRPTEESGVSYYDGAGNAINGCVALDRLLHRDFWRDTVLMKVPDAALNGPLLSGADYPEVLVARAISTGADLDLVLYPGVKDGPQKIGLSRLNPGSTYLVGQDAFTADQDGQATLTVVLTGRTHLHIRPA